MKHLFLLLAMALCEKAQQPGDILGDGLDNPATYTGSNAQNGQDEFGDGLKRVDETVEQMMKEKRSKFQGKVRKTLLGGLSNDNNERYVGSVTACYGGECKEAKRECLGNNCSLNRAKYPQKI